MRKEWLRLTNARSEKSVYVWAPAVTIVHEYADPSSSLVYTGHSSVHVSEPAEAIVEAIDASAGWGPITAGEYAKFRGVSDAELDAIDSDGDAKHL